MSADIASVIITNLKDENAKLRAALRAIASYSYSDEYESAGQYARETLAQIDMLKRELP